MIPLTGDQEAVPGAVQWCPIPLRRRGDLQTPTRATAA